MEDYCDSLVLKVIETYGKTDSIEKTAVECGISTVKVRKILITHRMWSSETSYTINTLIGQGKTVDQVAKLLRISTASVSAYTPYDRGMYYGDIRSTDSQRAALYRQKIKEARENQVFVRSVSKDMKRILFDNRPFVLRLELDFGNLNNHDKRILMDYGKSVDGRYFRRDVLVPGDITLNALHYLIQKLFGWQNSHLRSFRLPDSVFDDLSRYDYYKLCGVLFRIPEEGNYEDYYWSDDYEECESFSTWLQRKYTGPYYYGGKGDFYQYQQLKSTRDRHWEEYNENDLLQRLPVASVLADSDMEVNIDNWYSSIVFDNLFPSFAPVTKELVYEYDFGDGWEIKITRPSDVEFSDRQFRQVMESYKPLCLKREGIMLLDDVGGLGGYIDFLDCIYGNNPDTCFGPREETLAWARSTHGWSKKNISISNLL